jgi:hypothetical protein
MLECHYLRVKLLAAVRASSSPDKGDKTHYVVLEDVEGDTVTIDYGGLAMDFDKVAPQAQKLVDSVKWGGS